MPSSSKRFSPFCWYPSVSPIILVVAAIVVLNLIGQGFAYLIIVTEDEPPGHVVFNATLPRLGRNRHYKINTHRSAGFVHRILHVHPNGGQVVLKRHLECDGLFYPNLFTVYIDSTSNTSRGVDYYSLPLRLFITGKRCEKLDEERDEFELNRVHVKVSEAKRWISETFASFAIPGSEGWHQICLRKSQFINSITSFLPSTVLQQCHVRYLDVSDPRFRIESVAGDLVSAADQCIVEPLWKVTILLEFYCNTNIYHPEHEHTMTGIVSSAEHRLKIVYHHQDLNDTDIAHRVRRELRNQSPYFEQTLYVASVMEEKPSGAIVTTVKARDPENSPVSYSMLSLLDSRSQGMFAIDSGSGVVTTLTSLDRELVELHYFRVTAVDDSFPPRSGTTTLQINVLDANDHAPVFESGEYEAAIRESVSVGSTVVEYSLVRQDGSGNEKSDSELEDAFRIDPKSGIITTRTALDREKVEVYTLVVMATDQGLPSAGGQKSSTATVVVRVLDDNDNYPQFTERTYTVQVPEDINWSENPVIATVKALDTDQGNNAAIRYAIIGGNTQSQFSIDSLSGEVSLVKPLDYEILKNFRLVIRAQDGGSPSRSNTTQLLVNVLDVNDNAPRFYTYLFQESVSESVPTGFSIVKNGRGLVTIAQPLDYKQEKRFVLTITASDSGGRQDTATLYVNVSDANNYAPVFENAPYSASVFEDAPIGTTVLVVAATDGDVGQNAQITYMLGTMDSTTTPEFTINPQTGAIITTKKLDRETVGGYLLTVTARDGGVPPLSDTTDVEIIVSDVNDNPPIFRKQSYVGSVPEDAVVGTSVVTIQATDADMGYNGRIRYALDPENSGDGSFIVDPMQGVIRTAKNLDRESVAIYDLIAYAIDRGSPSLSSSVEVKVRVEDVNDSPPAFDRGDDSNSFSLVTRPGSDKAELVTMVDLDYESSHKKYDLVVRAASPPLRTDAHVTFNNFRDCFPSGPVGKIPAFDADVSDQLYYRILSGNNANLVHLNSSSGELTLSPQLNTNVPKVASMEVSVTDGVNEVKAMMHLTVRLVTEEMLFNSITVRLDEMTEEAFLSPLLTFFIEGLAAIIPCPKDNIFVFSIQDDTDVNAKILNVSFSARRPDLNGEEFYSPQFLQERVYLNRAILARLSTVQVLPFDDNLCVREPCLNYEECLTVLKFGNASGFISSDTVLFRPIYPVTTFACRCPKGFTGSREHYLCDTEVNLCYSNPCGNQGICQRKEGGYVCVCKPGFTGQNCEIDMNLDTCQPGICRSHSTCSPLVKGGFRCENCSPNGGSEHYTKLCELRSRSFSKASFLTFPSLRQRHRLHIRLRFATQSDTGLLLYNGRYNEKHDFIALEIVGGAVHFSFLDLTGPLQVGGLPSLPTSFQVHTKDFVGCISDLYIDHKFVDLNSYVADNGTVAGCPEKKAFCLSNPCTHGAKCREGWGTYLCDCPEKWSDKDCSREINPPWRFQGNGVLSFNPLLRPIQLPWLNALSVRTLQRDAFLMSIQIGQNSSAVLSLVNGQIHYSYNGESITLPNGYVSDGRWHHIEVKWMSGELWINFDYGQREITAPVTNKLQGLVGKILIGGPDATLGSLNSDFDYFEGCIQDVRVGTPQSALQHPTENSNVAEGCSALDQCRQPGPDKCPIHSRCISDWEQYYCKCDSDDSHPLQFRVSCITGILLMEQGVKMCCHVNIVRLKWTSRVPVAGGAILFVDRAIVMLEKATTLTATKPQENVIARRIISSPQIRTSALTVSVMQPDHTATSATQSLGNAGVEVASLADVVIPAQIHMRKLLLEDVKLSAPTALGMGSKPLGTIHNSPMLVFPKYNNYLLDRDKFDTNSRVLVPLHLLGIKPLQEDSITYRLLTDSGPLPAPVLLRLWLHNDLQPLTPRANPQCVHWSTARGMLTEMRDINHGPMRFYYTMGYGLPAVVVGLAVGVRADQYGNFYLTLLWLSVVSLPLLGMAWVLAVLSVSERLPLLSYLLSIAVLAHAMFALIGYCFLNTRVRRNLYVSMLRCLGKKVPLDSSEVTTGVSEESPSRARRQESDSDSEVSVDGRSLELASSHSSDDDESSNRHRHRDVGVSTMGAPSYLPNICEDPLGNGRGSSPHLNPGRGPPPTIHPPPSLNIINNSQLFPNLKPIYAPRWSSQLPEAYLPSNMMVETGLRGSQWSGTASDNETSPNPLPPLTETEEDHCGSTGYILPTLPGRILAGSSSELSAGRARASPSPLLHSTTAMAGNILVPPLTTTNISESE
ncbi:Protocadherin-like wing polarity protein stan [Blattella germanica]|nr:Protocadherin-like wing polarity protein stan [Blattella germanica]